MPNIGSRIEEITKDLAKGVKLVAVSKFHPVEALREAYDAGQRIFGESRVQEIAQKYPQMPSDVQWHFIGHLQTNKVKYIADKVYMIQLSFSISAIIATRRSCLPPSYSVVPGILRSEEAMWQCRRMSRFSASTSYDSPSRDM